MASVSRGDYRKIGKFGFHTLLERSEDRAVVLCCTSTSTFGGVSVTVPALERFAALPNAQKFVLLRNTSQKWETLLPLAELPEMIANPGRIGDDGKQRADYRIYDYEDVPHDTEVDPKLLEYLQQSESRRMPTIPI